MTTKFTPEARELFLLTYAEVGNIAQSCRLIGISPRTVRYWRDKDEDFSKAYDEARSDAADTLEAEAIRRARDGIQKKIYHQGICVDVTLEYSDSLLQFLLRGLKPDTYGLKQQVTLDAANVPPARVHNDDDRQRLLRLVKTGESA